VPDGFEPTNGANYRGTKPQKAELVALPLAIRDLGNFTNYAAVIGSAAPPFAEVVQTFDVTNQWSSMRNASSAWDEYARDQEGIAWSKAAAKAALAAQTAKGAPEPSAPVATPIEAAPVVDAPAAPAPAAQPVLVAAPPAASGTPAGSNGASHS
jgi:hypothetical protein